MTLTDLRYLVALAHERHFGRAAEKCHVSQPTLSVAVKKVEEELGARIFERTATGVTVTPDGERVVEAAEAITGSYRALVAELQQHVQQKLSKHKYPRWVVFVDELPKNDRGKVNKQELARREKAGELEEQT